jgi:hypothetical protein
MRKVMLLAAMLAMVLAAAAPAFAQAVAIDEGDDVEYNAVCQNIIGSIGDINQDQSGSADAVATDDSAAAADVAQSQDVTIEQVNNCLNEADLDGDGFVTVVEKKEFVSTGGGGLKALHSASSSSSASSSASTAAEAQYSTAAEAQYSTPAAKVLPETGGASLLALGAGALLVAGGLVARRIVR